MKNKRLITTFFTILFLSGLIHAIKPVTIEAEADSKVMVDKIAKDVVLTPSQKVALTAKAKEFLIKSANYKNASVSDPKFKDAKVVFDKKSSSDYVRALDSILTSEQKGQRLLKIKERKDEVVLKNKSKTKK